MQPQGMRRLCRQRLCHRRIHVEGCLPRMWHPLSCSRGRQIAVDELSREEYEVTECSQKAIGSGKSEEWWSNNSNWVSLRRTQARYRILLGQRAEIRMLWLLERQRRWQDGPGHGQIRCHHSECKGLHPRGWTIGVKAQQLQKRIEPDPQKEAPLSWQNSRMFQRGITAPNRSGILRFTDASQRNQRLDPKGIWVNDCWNKRDQGFCHAQGGVTDVATILWLEDHSQLGCAGSDSDTGAKVIWLDLSDVTWWGHQSIPPLLRWRKSNSHDNQVR